MANKRSEPSLYGSFDGHDYFLDNDGSAFRSWTRENRSTSADQIRELNDKLKHAEDKITALELSISDAISDVESSKDTLHNQIEEAKKNFEDKVERDKFKAVEIIGVFVALFTFVSSEIQIYSKVNSIEKAVAVSLVFAGMLNLFVTMLLLMVKPDSQSTLQERVDSRFWMLLFVSSVLIISGVIWMWQS